MADEYMQSESARVPWWKGDGCGENILGCAGEGLRKAAGAVCRGEGMDVLNQRDVVHIASGAKRCSKGAGLNFISFLWGFVEKARRKIGAAWRLARCGFDRRGREQASRRSPCSGLPLFLRFSGDRSLHRGARIRKTWGGWNDLGYGRLGFREQGGGRVNQRADDFGRRHRRRLQRLMVIEHPSGEHGFGRLLDPLIHQCGNLLTQIRSVIEPSQLKTLQRGTRSGLQIV